VAHRNVGWRERHRKKKNKQLNGAWSTAMVNVLDRHQLHTLATPLADCALLPPQMLHRKSLFQFSNWHAINVRLISSKMEMMLLDDGTGKTVH
jgi:hypothetical protein